MSPKEQAEKNISAFIEKYGEKGFLELYFTNYLFELLMAYIRSHSDKIDYDSGYQYHFGKGGRLVSPMQEKQFRHDLKKECAKKGKAIVSQLEERGILSKFGTDVTAITREATELVNKALKDTFESVFKTRWAKD
jgi:hypothetical protein